MIFQYLKMIVDIFWTSIPVCNPRGNQNKWNQEIRLCEAVLKKPAWLLPATHPQGGQVESSILK